MRGEFFITLDVDWAPDFAIDAVSAYLLERGVHATWFVTHDSSAIDRLRKYSSLFELGIHPNFMPGSTQGSSPREILDHLLSIVPVATSIRSHAVVQSSTLLSMITHETPIKLDSTVFLPGMPDIRPVEHIMDGKALWRVPAFWADDHEMGKPSPQWHVSSYAFIEGYKVMIFHPIHFFLNSQQMGPYNLMKGEVHNLLHLTEDHAQAYVNSGEGAGTLFREIVDNMSLHGTSRCLRDVHAEWKKKGLLMTDEE